MDDVALLAEIGRARDPEAFEALCRRYAPRLIAFVARRGVPDPEAVAQEVLLTVWRRAEIYDPERASVASWIFTIARNRSIDALRKERRPAPDPSDPAFVEANATTSVEAPDVAADRVRRETAVVNALGELPDEQRQIIDIVYWRGETFASAAAALDIPLGTAKSRLRLAVSFLRRHLSPNLAAELDDEVLDA